MSSLYKIFYEGKIPIPEKNKKNGRMVAFFVPGGAAAQLAQKFDHFPGDGVAADDLHITLALIKKGKNEDVLKTLKHMAKHLKPFKVYVNGAGMFLPNKYNEFSHVLYAKPESTMFEKVHKNLLKFLNKKKGVEADNGKHEFKPHITIKYCKKDHPPLDERGPWFTFDVDHLALADKGQKYIVRLGR